MDERFGNRSVVVDGLDREGLDRVGRDGRERIGRVGGRQCRLPGQYGTEPGGRNLESGVFSLSTAALPERQQFSFVRNRRLYGRLPHRRAGVYECGTDERRDTPGSVLRADDSPDQGTPVPFALTPGGSLAQTQILSFAIPAGISGITLADVLVNYTAQWFAAQDGSVPAGGKLPCAMSFPVPVDPGGGFDTGVLTLGVRIKGAASLKIGLNGDNTVALNGDGVYTRDPTNLQAPLQIQISSGTTFAAINAQQGGEVLLTLQIASGSAEEVEIVSASLQMSDVAYQSGVGQSTLSLVTHHTANNYRAGQTIAPNEQYPPYNFGFIGSDFVGDGAVLTDIQAQVGSTYLADLTLTNAANIPFGIADGLATLVLQAAGAGGLFGNHFFCARSRDDGLTWEIVPTILTALDSLAGVAPIDPSIGFAGYQPMPVLVSDQDIVYAVWSDFDIPNFIASQDEGETWS